MDSDSHDDFSKMELLFEKGSFAWFAVAKAGMFRCFRCQFGMDSIIDSLLSGFQLLCVADRHVQLPGLLRGMDPSMAAAIGTVGNLQLQFKMGSSSPSYSYSSNYLFMFANF